MRVLGLDVSTSTIGICIIDHIVENDIYKKNMVLGTYLDLHKDEDKKNPRDRIDKALIAISEFRNLLTNYGPIDSINIEDCLQSFRPGGSNAKSTNTLMMFNGIIQFAIFLIFKKKPHMIHPTSARKKAWEQTFKGSGETKKLIMKEVWKKYPQLFDNFPTKPRVGGYVDQIYDMCDAVTLALCIPNVKIMKK